MDTKELLTKAKTALILDQPFYATLLLSMPLVEDSGVKTFAVNGETIRYNKEFLESLSLGETTFVLAHEVMHCVLQHMYRRGSRDPKRWNIAGDYIINEILVSDRVGNMPKGALYNPALVAQGKGTSEGVYDLLPDDTKDESLDDCQDGATEGSAESAQKQAEMRVKIIQAASAAKAHGQLSAGLQRIVKDATKTRTDWKSVLRRFLSERARTDLSYAKPKRRYLADDIYLPSLIGEKLGEILIAVDCSGSIDEKQLNEFAAEIKAICSDVAPSKLHVVYFDSEITHHDTFGPDDAVEIRAHGGGGTAFSPIFEFAAKQAIEPSACVVLTDLDCSDFGQAPAYPVLWASTRREQAPFGEVVKL